MIRLRKPTSKVSWPIAVAIFVLVGVVGVYVFATQPSNRVSAVVGVLIIWACFVAMLAQWTDLDTQRGRLVSTRLFVIRRSVDLATAKIAVGSNGVDGVLFGARGRGAPIYALLLQLGSMNTTVSPQILTALADTVERFAPQQTETVTQLRAQAAYVAGGGAPQQSPLAALSSDRLTRAGGQAGIAATISDLLK